MVPHISTATLHAKPDWRMLTDRLEAFHRLDKADIRDIFLGPAESLIDANPAIFPSLKRIHIWNRTRARAEELACRSIQTGLEVTVANDLKLAIAQADIVSSATMSYAPIICGDWVKLGTHVDLVGAFKADMREADDALLRKARIFVDSRDTTIGHIGELMIPMAAGVISESDVIADLYDLAAGATNRVTDDEITVFKNGGGAHLDLMIARILHEMNAAT